MINQEINHAKLASELTLADVRKWAVEVGEKRDAVYELMKIPARLELGDDDLLHAIPADLAYFDKVIAGAPYGMVSKSSDLDRARRRGNSRVRALLERFFAAHGKPKPSAEVRESYTRLIDAVKAREGFTACGADFPTSTHKCLFTLRARCNVALSELRQDEIDRIFREATFETRKSIRKAINLLTRLHRGHNTWPEIFELLPRADLAVPAAPDRARRIPWKSLPEALRRDAEERFATALCTMDDLAARAWAAVESGMSYAEADAMVKEMAGARGEGPQNHAAALTGYRGAITWLYREWDAAGSGRDAPRGLADLFTREALEAACNAQIARSTSSATLKDPSKSQTLRNRLTNLMTVARHGMQDQESVSLVSLMLVTYADYVRSPKELTDDADRICRRLRDNPAMAAAFVNAPQRLAAIAEESLADARAGKDRGRIERALRLYEVAALYAIQVSRPLRPKNLSTIMLPGLENKAAVLRWVKKSKHAEITFAPGELKNARHVRVHVRDGDAEVLSRWVEAYRAELMEIRDLPESPYLFPGTARPRNQQIGQDLPRGALAASSLAELWDLGDRQLGLGLTPHQCRHAVATLVLAMEPGNFALAAAVLGDEEATVRAHYGKDSGEQAAVEVRKSLLAQNPDLFKKMKRSLECHAA